MSAMTSRYAYPPPFINGTFQKPQHSSCWVQSWYAKGEIDKKYWDERIPRGKGWWRYVKRTPRYTAPDPAKLVWPGTHTLEMKQLETEQ